MIIPVKQTDISDCGVACIKCILHYHNISEDLHRIKLHHPLKIGFYSFQEISEIFNKYNLTASGYESDLESLSNVSTPFIAHIKQQGIFNHFIVIERVSDLGIHYMDPAFGKNLLMSKEKFYQYGLLKY